MDNESLEQPGDITVNLLENLIGETSAVKNKWGKLDRISIKHSMCEQFKHAKATFSHIPVISA